MPVPIVKSIAALLGLLAWPASFLGDAAGLGLIAVLFALLAVWLMKKLSRQEAIRQAKGMIKAHFLEVRLYGEDLGNLATAQKGIMRQNLRYLVLNLPAALPLVLLFLLIIPPLAQRWGWAPAEPGSTVEVRLTLDPRTSCPAPGLTVPAGLEVVSPLLRLGEGPDEVSWLVRAAAPGTHRMRFDVCGATVAKELAVGTGGGSAPSLGRGGWREALENAREAPLPADGPVTRVDMDGRARRYSLFGWPCHWLVWFTLVSIGAGLAWRKVIKAE